MQNAALANEPKPLLTLLGVPWIAEGRAVLFILPKLLIGIVVALAVAPVATLPEKIGVGLIYGLLLNGVLVLHLIGHILSSKAVDPPMTAIRITPILAQTRYDDDPPHLPPRVHLVRAFGGPALNILLGTMLLILSLVTGGHYLIFFGAANKIIGVFCLLPIPTVDGSVIWREVRRVTAGQG